MQSRPTRDGERRQLHQSPHLTDLRECLRREAQTCTKDVFLTILAFQSQPHEKAVDVR